MASVGVIGTEEFVLGFELAGIKNITIIKNDALTEIKEMMSRDDIGIIIAEEKIIASLEIHERIEVENSIKPVVVQLSENAAQDNLRKLIKKSIGVDLWGMER